MAKMTNIMAKALYAHARVRLVYIYIVGLKLTPLLLWFVKPALKLTN